MLVSLANGPFQSLPFQTLKSVVRGLFSCFLESPCGGAACANQLTEDRECPSERAASLPRADTRHRSEMVEQLSGRLLLLEQGHPPLATLGRGYCHTVCALGMLRLAVVSSGHSYDRSRRLKSLASMSLLRPSSVSCAEQTSVNSLLLEDTDFPAHLHTLAYTVQHSHSTPEK